MGATARYAFRYPEQTDPADVPVDLSELATDVENVLYGIAGVSRYRGALTPAAFQALAGVTDGDVADVIADAALGVVWRFRYRAASASAYKWECLGGPPLTALVPAYVAMPVSAYADLPGSVGPSITVPLAGDYIADYSMDIRPPSGVDLFGSSAVRWGAVAPADDEAVWAKGGNGTNVASATSARRVRHDGVAAAAVCKLQYASQANSTLFGRRWLALQPARVSQ